MSLLVGKTSATTQTPLTVQTGVMAPKSRWACRVYQGMISCLFLACVLISTFEIGGKCGGEFLWISCLAVSASRGFLMGVGNGNLHVGCC